MGATDEGAMGGRRCSDPDGSMGVHRGNLHEAARFPAIHLDLLGLDTIYPWLRSARAKRLVHMAHVDR